MVKQTIRVIPYARAKSVHPAQIRNWVRSGLLPAVVIGRTILLDAEECDRVLETFKRPGKKSSTALPVKLKHKPVATVAAK
jgi:hypothetical protein